MKYLWLTTILLFAVLSIAGCGSSEEDDIATQPTSFLPDRIDSLELIRNTDVTTYVGEALFEHINGGAEIYHLYDFTEVVTAYYSRGETEVLVDIYQFATADNAYGLYTAIRPDGIETVPLGVQGFATGSSIDFVKGRLLVRLIAYDESQATTDLLMAFARKLEGAVPGRKTRPKTFAMFPAQHQVHATDKLAAESFLGRKYLAEVYSQSYRVGDESFLLFVTEDQSGGKYLQWSQDVEMAGNYQDELQAMPFDTQMSFITEDSYHGLIVAGLKGGKLLGLVGYTAEIDPILRDWLQGVK